MSEATAVQYPAVVTLMSAGYTYLPRKEHQSALMDGSKIHVSLLKAFLINCKGMDKKKAERTISTLDNLTKADDLGRSAYEFIKSNGLVDLDPSNNSFHVATEVTVKIAGSRKDWSRYDLVLYVNGIPQAAIEAKGRGSDNGMEEEHERLVERLGSEQQRQFLNLTQFFSSIDGNPYNPDKNGVAHGSYYTTPNGVNTKHGRFHESLTNPVGVLPVSSSQMAANIEIVNSDNNTDLEVAATDPSRETNKFLMGLFAPERLTFMLRFGIRYLEKANGEIVHHVIRSQQLHAVQATQRMINRNENKGILWHTQGAGKTAYIHYMAEVIRWMNPEMNTRFFYIADRLDLVKQTASELTMRGDTVKIINSRDEFEEIVAKDNANAYDFYIVNIQKFKEGVRAGESAAMKTFYFVDEAHRSYTREGYNLANLQGLDKGGTFIGLTGTPLIGGKVSSTDIHGKFIHTYDYAEAVRDGVTLKLQRVPIQTEFRKSMIDKTGASPKLSDMRKIGVEAWYIEPVVRYISETASSFRHDYGSNKQFMVVCTSREQALLIDNEINGSTPFSSVAVVSDNDSDNSKMQDDYKDGAYDFVVVYEMLSTGFDHPPLKMLFMLREKSAQNLLQTLARVNRPFDGMVNGHVVDFNDITSNFEEITAIYNEAIKNETGGASSVSDVFENVDIDASKAEVRRKRKWLVSKFGVLEDYSETEAADIVQGMREQDAQTAAYNLQTIVSNCNVLRQHHEHEFVDGMETGIVKAILGSVRSHLSQIHRSKHGAEESGDKVESTFEVYFTEGKSHHLDTDGYSVREQVAPLVHLDHNKGDDEFAALVKQIHSTKTADSMINRISKLGAMSDRNGVLNGWNDTMVSDQAYLWIFKLIQKEFELGDDSTKAFVFTVLDSNALSDPNLSFEDATNTLKAGFMKAMRRADVKRNEGRAKRTAENVAGKLKE